VQALERFRALTRHLADRVDRLERKRSGPVEP
jgi:hypothetical protein